MNPEVDLVFVCFRFLLGGFFFLKERKWINLIWERGCKGWIEVVVVVAAVVVVVVAVWKSSGVIDFCGGGSLCCNLQVKRKK